MKETLLRPPSTDNALFTNFDQYLFAKLPLQDDHKLGGFKKPVSFIYGDRDWMLKNGAEVVLDKNPHKNKYSHLHIVENSDHHLYFDNPEGLTKAILKDLENINEF
jgi:pimeloyl-ACP methyl ester carboxylesterase